MELRRILFSRNVMFKVDSTSLKPSSPITAADSMPALHWAAAPARLQPGAATTHTRMPGVRKRTRVIWFEYGLPEAG